MTKLDPFRGSNPALERSPERHSRIVLYAWWTPLEDDGAAGPNGPATAESGEARRGEADVKEPSIAA